MARSGRGIGENIGLSDFIMDTGKPAVGMLGHILDRNYVSGGSRTVLDPFISVPADSKKNEKNRLMQSGGAGVKPALYEYFPEKPGAAGPPLSAVCAVDSADSRTTGFLFPLRPHLCFLCGGRRLFSGIPRSEPMASCRMPADIGSSDRLFQAVSGRSFPYGRTGGMPDRVRRRDRRVLWGEENKRRQAVGR